MDVRGALGLDDDVPNGFTAIRVDVHRRGRRPAGEAPRGRHPRHGALRRLRHASRAASPCTSRSSPPDALRASGRALPVPAGPPQDRRPHMPIRTHRPDAAGRGPRRLAERLAADLATRAPAHDRDGSYPFESIDALREARLLRRPRPRRAGGLGVESLHDLVVASARLARGRRVRRDRREHAHGTCSFNIVRRWRTRRRPPATYAARPRSARRSPRSSHEAARSSRPPSSEPGQDITRPATTATRTAAGWRIDGRKIFCTMSPAATRPMHRGDASPTATASERYGYAQIPARAPGVVIHDDWDALGMRASGSHSVTFDGVELPGVRPARRLPGRRARSPTWSANLDAGLFHAAASLGIAESAHDDRDAPAARAASRTPAPGCSSRRRVIALGRRAGDAVARGDR